MMGTPSSSKKSRGLLRLTLIGLIVLLVGTVIHIRPYSVATPSAQALWNQNELYIFVEQNKVASSQNIWSFSWTVAQGPFGFKNTPAFHRLDCLVYRVTSSKIEEHLAKGWDVAGTIAPYKGVPHAFIGGNRDAGVYEWTGNDFAKLTPTEAVAANSGYTNTDELFKREGWSGVQFLLPRGTADHSVLLGDTQFVMRVTHTDDGTTRVELINSSEPKPVRVLYDFKDKTGFLSAREYKGLTE